MDIIFNSKKAECTLAVTIKTIGSQNMHLIVRDAYKPFTVYTDRTKHINGTGILYVRMPQSPEKAMVEIYNQVNGNLPKMQDDNTFRLVNIEKQTLKRKFSVGQLSSNVRGFVKFAQWFCENAGVLSAGSSVYISDDNKFRIDYVDIIRDRNSSKPKSTPARISQSTGVIEISKHQFKTFTIPMRMAILLHEFSHFYINKNAKDEVEADLNALLIYLGLGYPRIEAHYAFLKVFINSPSDQNLDRHKKITAFIDNFENMNIKPL